jgi:dTDP-4-dehydrorhamnose reductase
VIDKTDYTPTMKWAIVGSRGMLGSETLAYLSTRGETVQGFHRGNLSLASKTSEIANKLSDFDIVVNCIAFTAVDQAESQADEAYQANVSIPARLAHELAALNTRLIHVSTDYVFDGLSPSPYLPGSEKNPQSVYGVTKSLGEDYVLAEDNTQVVRTAWLYGAAGNCFPKTIVKKLLAGQKLNVVDDQFGTPTYSGDLAEFIFNMGTGSLDARILHGVSSGDTTWFNFAREIAKSLGLDEGLVHPIGTERYPTPAKRPTNSILTPSAIGPYSIPHWRTAWQRASNLFFSN